MTCMTGHEHDVQTEFTFHFPMLTNAETSGPRFTARGQFDVIKIRALQFPCAVPDGYKYVAYHHWQHQQHVNIREVKRYCGGQHPRREVSPIS